MYFCSSPTQYYQFIIITDELEQYLSEQFSDNSPTHIDLLTNPHILSNPVFTLTDYHSYPSVPEDFTRHNLPPRFIIGFGYKPDINTILRLFSINIINPPSLHTNKASTLLLSSSLTLVYESTFMIPWANITHTDTNNILLYINNGELSYCINGHYIPHIWSSNLWLHNISRTNIELEFSHYLREVADRVSESAIVVLVSIII